VTETVRTIDGILRTLLILGICAALGTIAVIVYQRVTAADRELEEVRREAAASLAKLAEAEAEITTLREDLVLKQQQIDRLETAMHLLKTDRRLARIEVLEQTSDVQTGQVRTRLRFTELSPQGTAIGPAKEFEVAGETVYLDNWVVKFEDRYVEDADLQRGTSLALFRRIFGEDEAPAEAAIIDEVGVMPQAYVRGGLPSDFEQQIWEDFWTFANDRQAAREKGIRAAHGEALSMKVEVGRSYRVELRASDGLSIVPEEEVAAADEPLR
jgi:hypothetical protein